MNYVKKDDKKTAEKYWLTQLNGRSMVEHMVDRLAAGEIDPVDAERIVGPLYIPDRST